MTQNITSLGSTPDLGNPLPFPTRRVPLPLPRCAQDRCSRYVEKVAYLTGVRQSAVVDRPQQTRRATSLSLSLYLFLVATKHQ